jgi:tetratricopeptide (TPR) repeat protein
MSAKVGRNEPCPCGSGKKYKACCLPLVPRQPSPPPPPARARAIPPFIGWLDDDDDLDELSNSVVDLVQEGRLDEADKVCDELFRKYPDIHDHHDRRGMVLEARGRPKEAAEQYRQAARLARQQDGVDDEIVQMYIRLADELDPPA